jgi:hypothetical protein
MPDDPVIRWENEGGAILLANGTERDPPRDDGEAEVNDVTHMKDRKAETPTRVPTRRDGSTATPVD